MNYDLKIALVYFVLASFVVLRAIEFFKKDVKKPTKKASPESDPLGDNDPFVYEHDSKPSLLHKDVSWVGYILVGFPAVVFIIVVVMWMIAA